MQVRDPTIYLPKYEGDLYNGVLKIEDLCKVYGKNENKGCMTMCLTA